MKIKNFLSPLFSVKDDDGTIQELAPEGTTHFALATVEVDEEYLTTEVFFQSQQDYVDELRKLGL